MHGHLDFSERLFFPSSGFTLVEVVAVRSTIKAKGMEGECVCLLREDDSNTGFLCINSGLPELRRC